MAKVANTNKVIKKITNNKLLRPNPVMDHKTKLKKTKKMIIDHLLIICERFFMFIHSIKKPPE